MVYYVNAPDVFYRQYLKIESVNIDGTSVSVDMVNATDSSNKKAFYRIERIDLQKGGLKKKCVIQRIERPTFPE